MDRWAIALALVLAVIVVSCDDVTSSGSREVAASVPRPVQVPYDRWMLIRDGGTTAAFRISTDNVIGARIRYRWQILSGSGAGLTGSGEAVEVHGFGRLAIGGFVISWSRRSRDSGWLYWPDDRPNVEFSQDSAADLEQARQLSDLTRWRSRPRE